jgi:L-alanine-DL-glutamate epimerase-like enolase superfamily enzyme
MSRTITSYSVERVPLELRESYTIAYQTVSSVENIFFTVHLSDGYMARGVSAPEPEVTGETIESTESLLNTIIRDTLVACKTPADFIKQFPALREQYQQYPAMLASLDFAILSLRAHEEGLSIGAYTQTIGKRLPTTITINIHPAAETLERAQSWLKHGFTMLKIKGGLAIEEDLSKLSLLRKTLGLSRPILFDANQGYDEAEARYFLKESKKFELLAIEQPVAKEDTELLLSLVSSTGTPIMADEAACSLKDVAYLAEKGVQYFNIKLMKCGGTEAGQALAREVVRHGRRLIFSCMDECALSNAYSLVTALAIPQVTWVDLDSFTDYTRDPSRSSIVLQDGLLSAAI